MQLSPNQLAHQLKIGIWENQRTEAPDAIYNGILNDANNKICITNIFVNVAAPGQYKAHFLLKTIITNKAAVTIDQKTLQHNPHKA